MKIIMITMFLSFGVQAGESKARLKNISKSVEKREGYCSPLDKVMKKCETPDSNTDKKILKKISKKGKAASKKIEKRKDYCSPLDKMMGNCKKN